MVNRLPRWEDTLMRVGLLLAVLIGPASVDVVLAADPADTSALPSQVLALSDSDVEARLGYLEERLDARRGYSRWWWNGWTGFYSLGVVVQTARAIPEDDTSKRADLIVSAVKATGGVVNLLRRPLQAKRGADPVRALPSATADDRRLQLVRAEEQLRINAKEADGRYSWLRHTLNVGVNCVGAVIVDEGFDDPWRGWRSAGIGIAVGEAMIWSQPWWPTGDLRDYEQRFGASPQRISWRIVPTLGGAAFHATF